MLLRWYGIKMICYSDDMLLRWYGIKIIWS